MKGGDIMKKSYKIGRILEVLGFVLILAYCMLIAIQTL